MQPRRRDHIVVDALRAVSGSSRSAQPPAAAGAAAGELVAAGRGLHPPTGLEVLSVKAEDFHTHQDACCVSPWQVRKAN